LAFISPSLLRLFVYVVNISHQVNMCIEFDRVKKQLYNRSSNWTLINQPSRTTWNPSHDDTESTPFVIDKQRQDYEAMLTGE